jgi:soluble lytic murein transglycosylase-like protein
MSFRLNHKAVVRFAGLAIIAAGTARAASMPPRVKSIVRADSRGRLVRTVVVTNRVTQPKHSGEERQAGRTSEDVLRFVESAAKRHDVDPLLVHSVIQVESNYNPYAVSPKGAQGLMQLMPATARRFGVRNTFDPEENIEGGVRYLKYLTSLFPDNPSLTLAAYNAGEGAVWKYGNTIPPYRETEQYVQRVRLRYGQARGAAARAQAAHKPDAVEPASSETAPGPENTYASVHAFIDSEGRLHLRNAAVESRLPAETP